MPGLDPDLRRTWLFGPGADRAAHDAMLASGADALIVDLEDFTPPPSRDHARGLLANFVKGCRDRGAARRGSRQRARRLWHARP